MFGLRLGTKSFGVGLKEMGLFFLLPGGILMHTSLVPRGVHFSFWSFAMAPRQTRVAYEQPRSVTLPKIEASSWELPKTRKPPPKHSFPKRIQQRPQLQNSPPPPVRDVCQQLRAFSNAQPAARLRRRPRPRGASSPPTWRYAPARRARPGMWRCFC